MISCPLLLCLLTAGHPEPANLVPNPGFEEVVDGRPAGWRLPAGFRLSDEQPRTGARCLRWDGTDPARYVLATAPVTVEVGRRYEIEAWVRTENVQGNESGATICLEWSDAAGKWLGGSYPGGIRGTSDGWRRIYHLTGPIPAGAASLAITCYARRGMTGTAWWDDVSVRRWRPALLETGTTNAYRNVTPGGPVDLWVSLHLPEHDATPATTTLGLTVLDAAGSAVAEVQPIAVTAALARFTLDADRLTPGSYTLRVDGRTAAGVTGRLELPLRRVAERPAWKAWIDEHQRLILDGQPYFPLGTYWGAMTEPMVRRYAESPFNCLMPYQGPDKPMLDLAAELGLKVIYTVKDFYGGRAGLADEVAARRKIEQVVTTHRDHPAIMAWYINDELPLTMLEALTAHRDWLEELDPTRPTWVVLYQVDEVRSYLPTFDVIGTDPYPLPNRPIAMAGDWTRTTIDQVFGARAVWQVPQIFDWASYHPERGSHPPTLEEMRNMAWQCLVAGAKGLIFYSWFDLWRMDKTTAEGGRATVRQPFDQRWADVCQMAGEIKPLTDVLLSVEPPPALVGELPPNVTCRAWRHAGAIWLAVVNANREPATVSLTCAEELGPRREVIAGGPVTVTGRRVTFELPPLGVSVQRCGG